MTNDDWSKSKSAPTMLAGLYLQDPETFKSYTTTLHHYFLACCWKIKFLIPQQDIRNGLRGAKKWSDGKISKEAFWRLEWFAEAEAFAFENIKTEEEKIALNNLIDSIIELKGLSHELSHKTLMDAAYFANSAMVYPSLSSAPYDESLCTSKFLCPILLRKFLQPEFHNNPRKGSLNITPKHSG